MSYALAHYWKNETARNAVIKDVRPLVKAGVQFIVSYEAHGTRTFAIPRNRYFYCSDLGITPANTNGNVRDLLALRTKRDTAK